MEESQQLSELWLKNLKELINTQHAKINQMQLFVDRVRGENKSLKTKLNDRDQKISHLENQLKCLSGAKKPSEFFTPLFSHTQPVDQEVSSNESGVADSAAKHDSALLCNTAIGLEENDLPTMSNIYNTSNKRPAEDTITNFMEYSLDVDSTNIQIKKSPQQKP